MNEKKIALIGNPNVGKTSLFNQLTGLNQKIGNYPGITVEKKSGIFTHQKTKINLIDLPGTYGIYPSSLDEEIVVSILSNPNHGDHPDLVVVVSDASNLKRSILLFKQIKDLGLPSIFVINMMDEAKKNGISIDVEKLSKLLDTKVVTTIARSGQGLNELKEAFLYEANIKDNSFKVPVKHQKAINEVQSKFNINNTYKAWQLLAQQKNQLSIEEQNILNSIKQEHNIIPRRLQVSETLLRNKDIDDSLANIIKTSPTQKRFITQRIDEFITHPILGYVIFFALLLLIFQAIFAWSAPFMDGIEEGFSWINSTVKNILPPGPLSDILTDGVISGIGGVVVFIPQIVILFVFITIMEESGYMSRVVFLMDRWLKPFGLSGKSVVPLMSGAACAIPAIMSARNIENDKERLITILVTPFMTCSARLPIYSMIISIVIPESNIWIFRLDAIALFVMYIFGVLAALGSAWLLKKIIKSKYKSYLILEMPSYKIPVPRNVLLTVWEKTLGFVLGAGKIILAISIILWVLGSFGISNKFNNAEEIVTNRIQAKGFSNFNSNLINKEITAYDSILKKNFPDLPLVSVTDSITIKTDFLKEQAKNREIASFKLEHSFLGNIGQLIEPVVKPLGYDWKMGIGLIASFAAREVFVGTMATVYSLGDDVGEEDNPTIKKRMENEINLNTQKPAYNLASGVSLLLFYAFSMQCMSTIAIVKKETFSWKWTLIQLGFMTGLAYVAALIAYQFLK